MNTNFQRRVRGRVGEVSFPDLSSVSMKSRKGRRETEFVLERSSMKTPSPSSKSPAQNWTFFSNHAHVLLCLYRDGDTVLRDVALEVGITERAVQKIVAELEFSKILSKEKIGRCNRYTINRKPKLRHRIEAHRSVGDLLDFIQ